MIPSNITIVPVLQLAVSPAILISAVGLIILTLSNRLAHSINRLRLLVKEGATATGDDKKKINSQIAIIYQRASIMRWSIMFMITSALSSSVLIISLFITTLLNVNSSWIYIGCFTITLLCLIASLLLFAWEVNAGLAALRIEFENNKE